MIPLTPGGILWAGVITPQVDPVVESMLPEEYGFTWDLTKFSSTVFSDYLFADLVSKFMFHEQYTLTLSQEIRMRMWVRAWQQAGRFAVAAAPVASVVAISAVFGYYAAEAGGFDKMVGVTSSGDPSIIQGVFNRWTRKL